MPIDSKALVRAAMPISRFLQNQGIEYQDKGAGKGRARCIIHNGDNKTAMSVNDSQGIWNCFVCDKGGDIFSLYMFLNPAAAFPDAIESLAGMCGVQLPDQQEHQVGKKRTLRALADVSLATQEWLLGSPDPAAAQMRSYLKERGVTKSVARRWGIGGLPPGDDAVDFVASACGDSGALKAAGFLHSRSGGDGWIPLNGRLLFPIANAYGEVCAFGGRLVEGVRHSMDGKYVNSPNSSVFDKSKVLFGADLVTESTETVVVVEGYLDAIAVNEASGDDATVGVATCGTSLTSDHSRAIAAVPRRCFMFDGGGDVAGKKALVRAIAVANTMPSAGTAAIMMGGFKDAWEMFLHSPDDLYALTQTGSPLIQTAVRTQYELLDSDKALLDAWVREAVGGLVYDEDRDVLVKEAAEVFGQSPASYRRGLTVPSLTSRLSTRQSGESAALLSSATEQLVRYLVTLGGEELDGVLALLSEWSGETEEVIRNILPVVSDMDILLIKRLAVGIDCDVPPAVSSALSRLLPEDEEQSVDITVLLRNMASLLSHDISSLISDAPKSEYLAIESYITGLRRVQVAAPLPENHLSVLAYLIDCAYDARRITASLSSSSSANAG